MSEVNHVRPIKGEASFSSPPGSPYRDEITLGILQMQESNRLEILKRRWWEGGQCPKEEDHRAKGWSDPVNSFTKGTSDPTTAADQNRDDVWCASSHFTALYCAPGLGMENIGGIFVVLICGLIIAVFVAIMEFVWSTRRTAETDEVNLHPPLPVPSSTPSLKLGPEPSVGHTPACLLFCCCPVVEF